MASLRIARGNLKRAKVRGFDLATQPGRASGVWFSIEGERSWSDKPAQSMSRFIDSEVRNAKRLG